MEKNSKWYGEDICLAYDDKVLLIAEGTGDNLCPEDEDEYVDYFNLEVFEASEFDFDRLGLIDSIGGGFMLRNSLISEEFYGHSVEAVIEAIFEANGQADTFDLYTEKLPEKYKILNGEN